MSTPTAAEIRDATRQAIYNLTVAGRSESEVLGRRVRFVDLNSLIKSEAYWTRRAAEASDASGGAALVEFEAPS